MGKNNVVGLTTINIGEKFPGNYPRYFSGLLPTVADGPFTLYVLMPDLEGREIQAFSDRAKFIAIQEGTMLYPAAIFGRDEVVGGDTIYNLYDDSPAALHVDLPRSDELGEIETLMLL